MFYIVSVLTEKDMYMAMCAKKVAVGTLQMNSLYICYDSVTKTVSAPLSMPLLYKKYKQQPDQCAFTIEQQIRNQKTAYYTLTMSNTNFHYIPIFSITTRERLSKYRYFVLSRICNDSKITVALRLYDAVTHKEFMMSLDKVYKHQHSDVGTNTDVIGNIRIFSDTVSNQTTYKVKSVCGNMLVEKQEVSAEEKPAMLETTNDAKIVIDDCFVAYRINNELIITDIVYDYDWESHGSVLKIPNVNGVDISTYYTATFQGALHGIKTVVIPETVTSFSGEWLSVLSGLEIVESNNSRYSYNYGVLSNTQNHSVLWVSNQATKKLILKGSIIKTHAFYHNKVCTVLDLENCTVERCALQDSNVQELRIRDNVELKAGALRGLKQLKKVVICTAMDNAKLNTLCNFNTWLGLGDYSVPDKRFVGRTPINVQFTAESETYKESAANINKMLLLSLKGTR